MRDLAYERGKKEQHDSSNKYAQIMVLVHRDYMHRKASDE